MTPFPNFFGLTARSHETAPSEELKRQGTATQGSYALIQNCRPILLVGVHADSAQILEGFQLTG